MKKLAALLILAAMGLANAIHAQNNVTVSLVPQNPPYFGLWTDTGLSVTNGEWITINANGLWSISGAAANGNPPDGIFDNSWDLFLGNGLHGSLIAFVGADPDQTNSGSVFPETTNYWEVGTSTQFLCHTNGELWLGFNDDATSGSFSDNDGSMTATVFLNFNTNHASKPDLSLSVGQVTTNSFALLITNGIPNSACAIYDSSDLTHWTLMDSIMLDGNGSSQTAPALTQLAGSSANPMVSGEYANNTGVAYRFYKVSNGQFWSKTIGFVQIPIAPNSTNLIANQLTDPNGNTLDGLFNIGTGNSMIDGTTLPAGVKILKWDVTTHSFLTVGTWGGTGWSPNGSATMNPGESAFLENLTSTGFVVTFAGEVGEGQLTTSLSPPSANGIYISSQLPMAGGISSILNLRNPVDPITGYGPLDGCYLAIWNHQGYNMFCFDSSMATGFGDSQDVNPVPEPILQVGEGVVFENTAGPLDWIQNYSSLHF